MKAWRYHWKVRIASLLPLCALLSACALSAFVDSSGEDNAGQHEKTAASNACPSKDFTTFLQLYADATDDSVRLRFTEDPLEYEVPTHTVEDETASSPPTHVSRQSGRSRLEFFPYRYFKSAKAFDRIDLRDEQKTRQATKPYPVAISLAEEDGRRVIFGAEYEVDTYVFKRRRACWYLSRAINLRD